MADCVGQILQGLQQGPQLPIRFGVQRWSANRSRSRGRKNTYPSREIQFRSERDAYQNSKGAATNGASL